MIEVAYEETLTNSMVTDFGCVHTYPSHKTRNIALGNYTAENKISK
jgi:hypothetical protein